MYTQQAQPPANPYTQCMFRGEKSSLPTTSTGKGIWRMNTQKHCPGTHNSVSTHTQRAPKEKHRPSNTVTENLVLYPARLELDVDKNVLGGDLQRASPRALGHGLQLQGEVVLHPGCPAELLPLGCLLLTELAHLGTEIAHLGVLHRVKLVQTWVESKRGRQNKHLQPMGEMSLFLKCP